ncbi:MAG: 6-bladed beta-propeller [Thermodesulfobacteriota bacterium]
MRYLMDRYWSLQKVSRPVKAVSFFNPFFLIFILFFYLAGCTPPELPDIVWPLYPDPPRIKFIRSFKNARGVAGLSTKDILLGAEPMSTFIKPYGLHVDKWGRIYVSDTVRGLVSIMNLDTQETITLGTGRIAFSKPMGVATDSLGRIYVTDSLTTKIYVFQRDGRFFTIYGKEGDLIRPVGIAINNELKRIYVADIRKHKLVVFDLNNGKYLFDISRRGSAPGDLNMPSNLALSSKGNIYVTDFNGRVTVFNPDGKFLRIIGRYGDNIGDFARPKGLAFDQYDHLYVTDAAFNNVQIFDEKGNVLMAFSSYGAGRGQMILPAGIAIDKQDRIYVADQWNQRVNMFQFLSERYKKEHPEEMKKLEEFGKLPEY